MLEQSQLLEAYQLLTNSYYPIWDWKYDVEFNVISSNCPHESLFHTIMLYSDCVEMIAEHRKQNTTPAIYVGVSLFSWIFVFAEQENQIYAKGPFFNGYNDKNSYDEIIRKMNFSDEAKRVVKGEMRKIPMLTVSSIMQLAVMLHFAVNQEKVDANAIISYTTKMAVKNNSGRVMADQLQGPAVNWQIEDEILDKIRRGDTNLSQIFGKMRVNFSDAYQEKNAKGIEEYRQSINLILTLVSRTAVEGGLARKTSFALCADYRKKINQCNSLNELSDMSNEIFLDYANRVKMAKKYIGCSKQIRLCCEYIDNHPEEKITLSFLADRVGYTEFHLSRKFVQEMNCSIVDYIQRAKIEKAKFLLASTEDSVEDISGYLGYSSGSYFSKIFKNIVQMTPSTYRREKKLI